MYRLVRKKFISIITDVNTFFNYERHNYHLYLNLRFYGNEKFSIVAEKPSVANLVHPHYP